MGKNIVIVVLLGFVAFFGYMAWTGKTPSGRDSASKSPMGFMGWNGKSPAEKGGLPASPLSTVKQKVPVVIYSSDSCRYCVMAKAFLSKKGVQYEARDINIGKNSEEMMARTNGQRSIPQIFINHKHIGGWSELNTLEAQGKLNKMLLAISD